MSREFTYKQVAKHKSPGDLYTVVHDKVYNITNFVNEHPGGEEVLLDVAGKDATEEFEDVGHSDGAREMLNDLFVGRLKRLPGDPNPQILTSTKESSGTGFQYSTPLLVLILGAAAYTGFTFWSPESS